MSELNNINRVLPQVLSLHMPLPICLRHRRCKATSSAKTADSCCCNGSSLHTSGLSNLQRYISPLSHFRFFTKMFYGSFIQIMHLNYNIIDLMLQGGWYSSVGIATRYGLDGPGIES